MPARIARHPMHPMLIVFPIGLWVFSLVADLIFLLGPGNPFWRDVSFYTMVGGFIGALAAAIPGMIDYFSIRDSAAKRLGTTHMTLNLLVVALYAINLWLRAGATGIAGWPIALSLVAIVLLTISGWYGGDLVYVHGVGVEPAAAQPRLEPDTRPDTDETYARPPRHAQTYNKNNQTAKSGKEGRL